MSQRKKTYVQGLVVLRSVLAAECHEADVMSFMASWAIPKTIELLQFGLPEVWLFVSEQS